MWLGDSICHVVERVVSMNSPAGNGDSTGLKRWNTSVVERVDGSGVE